MCNSFLVNVPTLYPLKSCGLQGVQNGNIGQKWVENIPYYLFLFIRSPFFTFRFWIHFLIYFQFQSWWMQSFIFLRKTWSNQPFGFNATHFNIENSRIFRMLVTCPRSGNGGREVVLQLTEMLCIWIAKVYSEP